MAVIKIADRGPDPGGLVRYMFGKGDHNEHTNQRTVAGTCEFATAGDKEAIRQVHRDLRAYSLANPQVDIKGGHVWQASISLKPTEAPLSDGKWKAVAEDYMKGMGFADPAKAPVRWTAINHGLNTGGSDHIHIVMSMVREDGSRVSIHNDAVTSSKVIAELEQKYGLEQVQGRGVGATPRNFTGGEKGKAQDNGHEIERIEIEKIVRGTAASSKTEAEFVRQLRAQGMEIRPRLTGDVVTGYSVGMPGTNVHFAGGKIARDLTLPRLRLRWAEPAGGADAAQLEWTQGKAGAPAIPNGRETKPMPVTPTAVTRELQQLQAAIPGATTLELREIGQDLAGALALGSKHDPEMAKMSRDAGRYAQTRSYGWRPKHRLMNTGLLILQASDPLSPMGMAIMLKQVLSTLRTLHEFYQARSRVAFQPQGKGTNMTMATPDDGIGETAEGLAVVGVTVGAQAVQRALYNKQDAAKQAPAQGGGPANRPVTNPKPEWSPDHPGKATDPAEAQGEGGAVVVKERTWRDDPMSDRQRHTVGSYARNAGLKPEDLQGWPTWTKGDASDAIKEFQKAGHTPTMLTPDAAARFDPAKVKPRTTATSPSAGPIQGTDIRNPKNRGGRS